MTENQIYPISADFFDNNSSNSNNLLKLDLCPSDFLTTNSNSNSNFGILTTNLNHSNAKLTPAVLSTLQNSNQSMDSLRDNPILASTASISIPQRSSTSTITSSVISSSFTGGIGHIGGTFTSLYANTLQQQHQQNSNHQPKGMGDFSEYGIDVLDSSSLSPTMMQDNSNSNAMSTGGVTIINHHQQQHPSTGNNNTTNSMPTTITTNQLSITTATTPNIGDYIVYDPPGNQQQQQQQINNSNTMWSDIGNAMKTEPFQMEDDYIFQIEQGPTLAELNDETLLEDLNIEDFIHDSNYLITGHHATLHQLQTLSNSLNSPGSNSSSSSMPSSQHLSHKAELHQMQTQHQLNLGRNESSQQPTSPYEIFHSTPNKNFHQNIAFSPSSQTSTSPLINSVTPPPHANRAQYTQMKARTPLQELLKKDYPQSPDRYALGQSVPGPSTSSILMSGTALSPVSSGFGSTGRKPYSMSESGSCLSRLSSSAPTHLGHEQIWRRREPRQHLLSTGSLAEAESFSSLSTGSVLSPEGHDFSHDEGYSDYDSDHYEDFSSDNGSDIDDNSSQRLSTTPNQHGHNKSAKERFFWQYNVQAKGPKGQRLVIKTQLEDPHILNEVQDPVFSPNCSVRGIKHSGKARKGDGNDLTPNPRKLYAIGKELDKLGRTITEMTPVSELPFNIRPKSRKEKNKLASRACRLKKKAQHEANKIKLYGLEVEHRKLLNGIKDVKNIVGVKYQSQNPNFLNDPNNNEELNLKLEKICQQSTTVQIAGSSTTFVNRILEKVKAGQPSGGLEELKNM